MSFRSGNSGGFGGNRSGRRPRRSGGGFGGGFGGDRPRRRFDDDDSGSFERRRPEMHEATCDKCGKNCEVPFRPTGDKPVLCSDCFRKEGGGPRQRFSPRNNASSSGISQEQYKEINKKLDKILGILEMIEFEEVDEEDEDNEEESGSSEEEQDDKKSEEDNIEDNSKDDSESEEDSA